MTENSQSMCLRRFYLTSILCFRIRDERSEKPENSPNPSPSRRHAASEQCDETTYRRFTRLLAIAATATPQKLFGQAKVLWLAVTAVVATGRCMCSCACNQNSQNHLQKRSFRPNKKLTELMS